MVLPLKSRGLLRGPSIILAIAGLAGATGSLDGTWVGFETCVDHCDAGGHHQGTVAATLTIQGAHAAYQHDGRTIAAEFNDGSFLRGNMTTCTGELEGSVMVAASADGATAYGSFFSFNTRRLFHWAFNRSSAPPSPPSPGQSIFASGMGGYNCHRVPAAVNTGSSLLVFVESRHQSCGDQEPKDVNYRRSTDHGATWGPLTRVLGRAAETNATTTYRNPTPVHHTAANGSAVLVLNVVNSTVPSTSPEVVWPSLQLLSRDDGKTWAGPRRVVGMAGYEGVLAGPGAGIQLGRHSAANKQSPLLRNRILYCGATGYQAHRAMDGVIWYSDDRGATWTVSGSVFPGMQECQMAELADGRVMINFRTAHLNKTCACRAFSESRDGGETWMPVQWAPQLIEPTCSAGLINTALPAVGARDELFFSNPADTGARDRMTVRRSDDSGRSWPLSKLVWPGGAAYSVLVPLNDTHVGLVFENGEAPDRASGITFVALPKTLA
eukprot:g5666.t1